MRKIKKKILCLILSTLSAATLLCGCGKDIPPTFLSDDGNLIGDSARNAAFLELASAQAAELLSDKLDISRRLAQKKLSCDGLTVKTTYNAEALDALSAAADDFKGCDKAIALTDTSGAVLAIYSSSEEKNFALTPQKPCSALKPLSVYAPIIESGKGNWSSLKRDSAVKQVKDSAGNSVDWPSNASGSYSNLDMTLYRAIKESCNTVAVKWLEALGVGESMSYLSDSFGIPLDRELQISALSGNDEILGNLALGYLIDGVTPLDMAGFYTSFATGGEYSIPLSVTEISDKNGKIIFSGKPKPKEVFSADTAFIMNRLLKGPLTPGGTAVKANIQGVDVCGKTGTSADDENNWFVGITPEYSCAVWHNSVIGEKTVNKAPEIFARAVPPLKHSSKAYPNSDNVTQKIYCTQSGLLAGPRCGRIESGYFSEGSKPAECNIH